MFLTAGSVLGQQATFKSGTSIVPVLTTVTDAQGRLVPNLEQDDFTILDNGKPQPITLFQNETQPFTVVVMLDFSFSMNNNLDLLKAATEQFILRMLPADKGQVGAFSDKIQFSGEFTNDRDDLVAALKDLQFGNPTRLYDAIDASIDMLGRCRGPEDRARLHRRRRHGEQEGHGRRARQGQGHRNDDLCDRPRVRVRDRTGTHAAHAPRPRAAQAGRRDRRRLLRAEEDDRAGADVHASGAELHSLYTLGFTPTMLDNKEHRLDVKLKQAGHTGRARKSYIASADRLSGS